MSDIFAHMPPNVTLNVSSNRLIDDKTPQSKRIMLQKIASTIFQLFILFLTLVLLFCELRDLQEEDQIVFIQFPDIIEKICEITPRFLLISAILFISVLSSNKNDLRYQTFETSQNLFFFFSQVLHLPSLETFAMRNEVFILRAVLSFFTILVTLLRISLQFFNNTNDGNENYMQNALIQSIREELADNQFEQSSSSVESNFNFRSNRELSSTSSSKKCFILHKSENMINKVNNEDGYKNDITQKSNKSIIHCDGTISKKIASLRLDDEWDELPFINGFERTILTPSSCQITRGYLGFLNAKSGNVRKPTTGYWQVIPKNYNDDFQDCESYSKNSELIVKPSKLNWVHHVSQTQC